MGGESEGVNKVSARRMRLCQVASGLERERHCDAICITRLSVVVDVTRPSLVVECKGKGEYLVTRRQIFNPLSQNFSYEESVD